MIGRVNEIRLKAKQRRALQVIVSRPSEAAGLVRRARVVLLSDDGVPAGEIAMRLGLTAEAVSRIRRRVLHSAVKGLSDRPKAGRKDHALSPETVDKLVHLAMSPPPAGRARWTTRLLARQFGISSGAVSDALRRNNVKPHLVRTYKVSRDPEFASKVNDIVGLYLNPPEHAIVLSVDEKTSIQALERTQPPLPLRSGRAVRHTHDYKRHGIVDLYAALEIATGKVTHQVSASHTAHDFLAFNEKGHSLLSASRAARDPRQLLCARHTASAALARGESARAFPLHADKRLLAQPSRGLLRDPWQAVAFPYRLQVEEGAV